MLVLYSKSWEGRLSHSIGSGGLPSEYFFKIWRSNL